MAEKIVVKVTSQDVYKIIYKENHIFKPMNKNILDCP